MKLVKKQAVKDSKNRTHVCSSLPRTILNKASSLVGNLTGKKAALEICKFMGGSIGYVCYTEFQRSSVSVLNNGGGNCCDQTRLMLQLFDAAGISEYYDMYWVHVVGGKGGHVFAKLVNRKSGGWCYVDPCKSDPWNNYVTGWGEPPGSQQKVTSSNLLDGWL